MRINDSLSTLSQFRSQHLQTLQSTLSQLNRTHQTLSANHSHTLSQHNPTNHAAEILRLDTEKFKIAKQASDLEIEGERLAQEVARLGGVEAELEAEGVEGGEREKSASEDATVYVLFFPDVFFLFVCPRPTATRLTCCPCRLKLKLYRTLGIDVEADPTTGQYNKAVIRNAAKGDVHVVNIDPKFSRHFYTNYFWRTM